MKLTNNFKLSEFNIPEPTDQQIRSVWMLCRLVLQPLREHVGSSINITSAYRSPAHNKKIGGSKTSQHMYRQVTSELVWDAAVDINFAKYMDGHEEERLGFFEFCRSELSMGFSQNIWYTGTRHFHIGLVNNRKQGQCLIKHGKGYLVNENADDIREADKRLK